MAIVRLSIIVPVYNEKDTVIPVLERLLALPLPELISREIVVIDDASTDGSGDVIAAFLKRQDSNAPLQFHRHIQNRGKGGSIATALEKVTGDYFIIQDADLELSPADMLPMIELVDTGKAHVVYGSRFLLNGHRFNSLSGIANNFLTWFSNFSFGTRLTDMETCYKLIPVSAMAGITLKEMRFGFEPEITAKLARNKSLMFSEVPVTYEARNSQEGKKIGWKDGVRAVWCIVRYGWLKQS
jgi:glycosyltransferase involved in cell wall biosynthesis